MNDRNIAFLDRPPMHRVSEESADYHAADHAKQLHQAQGLVGDALNLAGLLLAALEDQGDRRAMQVHAVARVIEKKLEKALNRLDKHEVRYTTRHTANAAFGENAKEID